MGLWGWISNAAESVWEGTKEVAKQVAAPVAVALGSEEEWATSRWEDQKEFVSDVGEGIADASVATAEFVTGSVVTTFNDDKDYFVLHEKTEYKRDANGQIERDEDGELIVLHKKGDIVRDENGGYVRKDEFYEKFDEDIYGKDENGERVLLFKAGDFKIQQYEENVYKTYAEDVHKTNEKGEVILDENNQPTVLHKAGTPVLDEKGQKILLHKAGDYMEDKICNRISNSFIADSIERADGVWVPVGNGLATAGHYTGEFFAHTGSVILEPVCLGLEAAGVDMSDSFVRQEIHRRAHNVYDPVAGFTVYAVNNPGRAAALITQGVTNAVTSTVGFVGDVGRAVVWDYTLHPLAMATYNLGADAEDKVDLLPDRKFFAWTEGLNEACQIKNMFDEGSWLEHEGLAKAFGRIEPYIEQQARDPETGELLFDEATGKPLMEMVENPNANYERVLLYGPQAVAEVGIIVVTSAFTAGAGGAAYAAARGSSLIRTGAAIASKIPGATRTAEAVMTAGRFVATTGKTVANAPVINIATGTVVKTAEIGGKTVRLAGNAVAKVPGVKPLGRALGKVDDARGLGRATDVRHLDEAKDAVEAVEKLQRLQARNARTAFGEWRNGRLVARQERNVERLLTTGHRTRPGLFVANARASRIETKLQKAKEALERLKTGGGSADDIAKAEKQIEKLTAKLDNLHRPVTMSADDASELTRRAREKLTRLENELETLRNTPGASARQIEKAEKAVEKAQKAFDKAKEPIEALAQRQGAGSIPATPAPRGVPEMGYLTNVWETGRIGWNRGIRFADPVRSPVVEATMGTGAFGIGVYFDQKNAAEESTKTSDMLREGLKAGDAESKREADDMIRRIREGTLVVPPTNPGGSSTGTKPGSSGTSTTPGGTGSEGTGGTPKLQEQFPGGGKKQDDNGAVSPGAQSGEGKKTSMNFNLRGGGATGIPLVIPDALPAEGFTITVAKEDAARITESMELVGSGIGGSDLT